MKMISFDLCKLQGSRGMKSKNYLFLNVLGAIILDKGYIIENAIKIIRFSGRKLHNVYTQGVFSSQTATRKPKRIKYLKILYSLIADKI